MAVEQQVNTTLARFGPSFEATKRIDAFLARPPDDALTDRDFITNLLISQWGAGSLRGPAHRVRFGVKEFSGIRLVQETY